MPKLRAKKPDTTLITKPKFLVYGPPGVKKTWVALDFPATYYIDCEGGASLPAYQAKLAAANGAYLGKEEGSQDFATVIEEIVALATTTHPFQTLVIDSFSKLYLLAAAEAEARVGNDFGRDRKEANKPTRQLMTWLERLDLNVLLICHEKQKWARHGKELVSDGTTFDGLDKLEYDLHLCLRVDRKGAKVMKSRLEGFPLDSSFPWSFAEIEKRCGADVMLRPPKAIELPTGAELGELKRLMNVVKMPDGWEDKALSKAGVSDWREMDRAKVQACIKHLSAMVKPTEES